MFARVSTIMGKPEKADEVMEVFTGPNPPGLSEMKAGYALVSRKTGKVMLVALWETEEAMEKGAAAASQIREQIASVAGAPPATVEIFDLVGEG